MTDAEILTHAAQRVLSGVLFHQSLNELGLPDKPLNLLFSARDYWLRGMWFDLDREEHCIALCFLAAMSEAGDL